MAAKKMLIALLGAAVLSGAGMALAQGQGEGRYGSPGYGRSDGQPSDAMANFQQDRYGSYSTRFTWRTDADWFNTWFDRDVDWLQATRK